VLKKLQWKIAQKAEIRWWKNYLKDKDTVDYLEKKRKYWQHILYQIEDVVSIQPNHLIMDAGCGPAGIFISLSDNKIIAIDPLLDAYEDHLIQFKKTKYPNVKFITSPIEDIDLLEQVDIIFCMNAINHVRNLENSYQKLVSLLKPGGVIVISIDAHNYTNYKKLFRLLPGDILHPHQYDLAEYQSFLTNKSLKIVKTICYKKAYFFNHYIQVAIKQ
jgi:2-polyprenyl-6-hydroxyphenyl methylase/3-demethylubiquinone-9 3-methyltransferase